MKLYGTTTSPFVRRVRIVAAELGVPFEMVSTATEAGMAEMKALSPVGKVPVAVIDGQVIFDSHVIIDRLISQHGRGALGERDRWHEANLVSAIDGALEAAIVLFYLRRDKVAFEGSPYEQRQLARIAEVLTWLAGQLEADGRGFGPGLGLAEIALVITLDWFEFRQTYPVAQFGPVTSVRRAWADRPSFVASPPKE